METKFSSKKICLITGLSLILCLFIIIILIILLVEKKRPKWKNKDAIEQYKLLRDKYGKPCVQNLDRDKGIAIWHKDKLKNTCFELIKIHDESISHCVPKPHRDFLYTSINYEIPNNKVLDVISLSGSVNYDPLKKHLTARCATEDANIATLYLATSIGNGYVSFEKVKKDKLYKQVIESLSSPENTEIYYRKLCQNLKEQPGNPNWTGYFHLSFPEGCCPGYNPELNTCGIESFGAKGKIKTSYFEDTSPVLFDNTDKGLSEVEDTKESFYEQTGKGKHKTDKKVKPVLFS